MSEGKTGELERELAGVRERQETERKLEAARARIESDARVVAIFYNKLVEENVPDLAAQAITLVYSRKVLKVAGP